MEPYKKVFIQHKKRILLLLQAEEPFYWYCLEPFFLVHTVGNDNPSCHIFVLSHIFAGFFVVVHICTLIN